MAKLNDVYRGHAEYNRQLDEFHGRQIMQEHGRAFAERLRAVEHRNQADKERRLYRRLNTGPWLSRLWSWLREFPR